MTKWSQPVAVALARNFIHRRRVAARARARFVSFIKICTCLRSHNSSICRPLSPSRAHSPACVPAFACFITFSPIYYLPHGGENATQRSAAQRTEATEASTSTSIIVAADVVAAVVLRCIFDAKENEPTLPSLLFSLFTSSTTCLPLPLLLLLLPECACEGNIRNSFINSACLQHRSRACVCVCVCEWKLE